MKKSKFNQIVENTWILIVMLGMFIGIPYVGLHVFMYIMEGVQKCDHNDCFDKAVAQTIILKDDYMSKIDEEKHNLLKERSQK